VGSLACDPAASHRLTFYSGHSSTSLPEVRGTYCYPKLENWVPHLRDGFIVDKINIRAKLEPL
jgi:hypothetical protein